MKQIRKIMYDKMYKIEANGFALLSIVTGFLYGIINIIIDFIKMF